MVVLEMINLFLETTDHNSMVMVVTEMTSFMVVMDSLIYNGSMEMNHQCMVGLVSLEAMIEFTEVVTQQDHKDYMVEPMMTSS